VPFKYNLRRYYAYAPGAWAEPEKKRRDRDAAAPFKPFKPPPKNSQHIKEALNPVGAVHVDSP
jgi:hypothetical protein